MMVADLGYGIFLFIVTALGLKFFKLDDSKKTFYSYSFILAFLL